MNQSDPAKDVQIVVNGRPRCVAAGTTLAELLEELNVDRRQVAVEVNEQLVPRTDHAAHRLRPGDRLEIVTLVGGG